jgi:phosphoglycerate dehydrogenase-like enzyme
MTGPAGTWKWQLGYPVHRLRGSVLGLLSFGAIAQAVAARAAGFGLRVIAHDPYRPGPAIIAGGAAPVSFGELLEQSDYLVIQAPGRRLDRRAGIDDLDEEPAKRRGWKPSGPCSRCRTSS